MFGIAALAEIPQFRNRSQSTYPHEKQSRKPIKKASSSLLKSSVSHATLAFIAALAVRASLMNLLPSARYNPVATTYTKVVGMKASVEHTLVQSANTTFE